MSKLFDLRFVIGVFFLAIGLLLVVYSFASQDQAVQSVNKWCGATFIIFGGFMVFISLKKDADDELLEE